VYNPYKRSDKKKEQGIREGHSWEENFPFYSLNTIKRAFNKLEGLGILLSGEFNKLDGDRTKWYTIDYAKLEELLPYNSPPLSEGDTPSTQNESVGEPIPHPSTQIEPVGEPNKGRSLPVSTKTLATKSQPSVDPSEKEKEVNGLPSTKGLKLVLSREGINREYQPDAYTFVGLVADTLHASNTGPVLFPEDVYSDIVTFVFNEQIRRYTDQESFGKNVVPMLTRYLQKRWFQFQGQAYLVYGYYSWIFHKVFNVGDRTHKHHAVRELYGNLAQLIDEGIDIQGYFNWLHEITLRKGIAVNSMSFALKDGWVQAYRDRNAPADIASMNRMLEI
jgi:hypothetical protein